MSFFCARVKNPRPVSAENAATRTGHLRMFFLALTFLLVVAATSYAQEPVGIFENHADVGTVLHPGSAVFDKATGTYTLTGSGDNMWLGTDAFQLAWKKVSGDLDLTADISFATLTGNPHKKAVLMIRQSLDTDSVYADVALHASGLAALQSRDEKGALTHEIVSSTSAPTRVRITRRGDYVYMSLAGAGGVPAYDGESIRVPLSGDFYVGIGVCAHDKDVIEKATFSNVNLRALSPPSGQP